MQNLGKKTISNISTAPVVKPTVNMAPLLLSEYQKRGLKKHDEVFGQFESFFQDFREDLSLIRHKSREVELKMKKKISSYDLTSPIEKARKGEIFV